MAVPGAEQKLQSGRSRAPAALNAVAQQRAAGLREPVYRGRGHVYHKAESDSQNYIEAPCDRPQWSRGICGRPFLHAAHHLYLRFVRVQRPLAERVKSISAAMVEVNIIIPPLKERYCGFTVAKLLFCRIWRKRYTACSRECLCPSGHNTGRNHHPESRGQRSEPASTCPEIS